DDLSQQVARFGQKGTRSIRLDIRPSLPQRRVCSTRLARPLRSRSYCANQQWRIINRDKVGRREQIARPRRDHGRGLDKVDAAGTAAPNRIAVVLASREMSRLIRVNDV